MVHMKMRNVPWDGCLDVWLQRVTKPNAVGVDGEEVTLWNNDWIADQSLVAALKPAKMVVKDVAEATEVMSPKEVELFKQNAWLY
jgi:hypothetical protein